MKRMLPFMFIMTVIISLCSCSKQDLADMATSVNDEYAAIVWEDRTYVPYCAIDKTQCGQQIGIIDNDEDDKVFEYKGYSVDEWIINYYVMDGAMLYKEINVTDIPGGLQSEYEWNG